MPTSHTAVFGPSFHFHYHRSNGMVAPHHRLGVEPFSTGRLRRSLLARHRPRCRDRRHRLARTIWNLETMATTILSPANGGNVACNFKLDIVTDSPTISVSMEISCPNAGPQNNLPRSCKAKK